ncbi:MAG: hypothetical protein CL776_02565 [Chloroflexi bacterium]|nr:hypothetical protein [Chloroflexota bacterium]|tara:strand:- start:598 stop:1392 length:795 start_codon:yes stop_codon:yes gene_type:complete
MKLGIEGRVAIVGGASKGMGLATAKALAREGALVVMVARGADQLAISCEQIANQYGSERVISVAADLSKKEEIDTVVSHTLSHWGKVDISINNLGGPPPGEPSSLTDELWYQAMDLNFFSVVRMSQSVIPLMKKNNFGRIISVLSLSIKQPEENLALSTVARTAASSYSKVLSTEVASSNITVNTVLPGSIETDRLKVVAEMQAKRQGANMKDAMGLRQAQIPASRFGKAEEAADLICFLASDKAGFITGQNILIDGGQYKGVF